MRILINIQEQELTLLDGGKKRFRCAVSTSARGTGNKMDSYRTPLGQHRIRAKIGEGLPAGAVLVGRRWTGEIYNQQLAKQHPTRDWILTRILWLCGCQPGYNRLGQVDSMRRYIYMHGAPDDVPFGTPSSHGCIRLANHHIIALYAMAPVGARVSIAPKAA